MALWDLGFQCPACLIEEVRPPAVGSRADAAREGHITAQLGALADSYLQTMASAYKPSTWLSYQRCISEMVCFTVESGIQIFPVISKARAHGLGFFLEHLRMRGRSWARIGVYCTAMRRLCEAGNLPDPFQTFPMLRQVCEGLKKRATMRVKRKDGITINTVKALLAFWEQSEHAYRRRGDTRLADCVLRHQVCVALGFFGMRRSSEIGVTRGGKMGLLRSHVELQQGRCIRLFLQTMKNDRYSEGNEIYLAWTTSSGVALGDLFTRYIARLDASGIPMHGPFVCPSGPKGGYRLPASKKGFRPVGCLKAGLLACFHDLQKRPDVLKRYSWHSLRRGGASHAWQSGADERLIMSHGVWRSEAGIRPYLTANFSGKLSVSAAM